MAQTQIQRTIRRALSALEELRSQGKASGTMSDAIESARSTLQKLDREVGERGIGPTFKHEVHGVIERIESAMSHLAPDQHGHTSKALGMVRMIERQIAPSLEIPSRPLFGFLPVARVIPQDVHSLLDYTNGFVTLSPAFFSWNFEASAASLALGTSLIGISALTDYRLSLANVIPIEVHEALDYVWGASCIALPFVLGYYKRDPVAAIMHIATGAAMILTSLMTDYRAAKGRGQSAVAAAAIMGATLQPGVSTHMEYTKH